MAQILISPEQVVVSNSKRSQLTMNNNFIPHQTRLHHTFTNKQLAYERTQSVVSGKYEETAFKVHIQHTSKEHATNKISLTVHTTPQSRGNYTQPLSGS